MTPDNLDDSPAAEIYNAFTVEQIKALCEIDIPGNCRRDTPPLEDIPEGQRQFYRLKAYWALRGAADPGLSACFHGMALNDTGSLKRNPKNLRDLEEMFLPKPTPSIDLILKRCPQMAMIHALRGDVCEPYWWAALSITEHASPNFSRECSDGYAGFTEEELSERVARIHSEKKKPALCDRLDSVNRNACSTCKFKGIVRTPIALGFEHEPRGRKDAL